MLTRDGHFVRLNSYRNSQEYALYAERISIGGVLVGKLPKLVGVRWEISKRIYDEFLNLLPPLNWHGGSFMMREFCFATITTRYTQEGDRFYCEFVDVTRVEVP